MAEGSKTYQYQPPLKKAVEDAEFEGTYKTIVPKEGEIRLVANRNKECGYFYVGIEKCRKDALVGAGDENSEKFGRGFLPCKRLVDAHYRCLTESLYGDTLEAAPEEVGTARNDFFQCAFKQLKPMADCRKYFDEVLRTLYRMPSSKLAGSY